MYVYLNFAKLIKNYSKRFCHPQLVSKWIQPDLNIRTLQQMKWHYD